MAEGKKTTKKKTRRGNPRVAITETLNRLEKELPPNLSRMVRQVRKNLLDLEKQVEKARSDRERRWDRQQAQLRREIAKVLRRMEQAVEPKPSTSRRKAPRKKKSTAAESSRQGVG